MTAMAAAVESSTDAAESPSVSVAHKRKHSAIDSDHINGVVTNGEAKSVSPVSSDELKEFLRDLLVVLERHDTSPSILSRQLSASEDQEPAAKKAKLTDECHSTIADKLRSGAYSSTDKLEDDIRAVCEDLTKSIKEKQDSVSNAYRRGEFAPEDDFALLTGVLAFEKLSNRFISKFSRPKLTNGTVGDLVNDDDDDAIPLINKSKPGRPVLTVFANAQGPKQLFSSFQKPVHVKETDEDGMDGSVDVTVPLQESALPNFVVSTAIPAAGVPKQISKGKTFGERFPPPKNLPQIQPPKNTNKLLTKASTIGWISEEALSRSISRRSYNWCVTRLHSGKSLNYSKVHELPNDQVSPEERRRQRDRALSTGSTQPAQSEAARLAAQQAKDEALFRSAFSSFAPCYDNSDAVVPTQVKNEVWWSKVGRQRAERVFNESFDEAEELEPEVVDLEDEDKMFKEAVEKFDPAILQIDPSLEDHKVKKEDQEMEEVLKEITELIETLYSYQRIRNSTVSSNSTPMTPVGQRTALSEIIGTPNTPSGAEMEIYKTLKDQLTLLICQLPPSAVTRLNGDKLQKLNISTNILIETEDTPGIMEDDTLTNVAKPNTHGMDTMSHAARNVPRTTQLAPARPNQYYQQSHIQPRTPSASYPRPSAPSYTQGYAGGNRPQYAHPQAGYQAGYAQSPSRMNYQQNPQYYAQQQPQQQQQQQVHNRMNYSGYAATPQGPARQFSGQTPMQNYPRPPAGGYGYQQPVSTPQMRTSSPMQAPGNSPHFRNPSGGRTQYYPPATANAIGPTGFHTTLTTQEQQTIMDRQRQIALQNQARSAAMGQASANMPLQPPPSNYTTPSRNSSDTPQPTQMNGTPR